MHCSLKLLILSLRAELCSKCMRSLDSIIGSMDMNLRKLWEIVKNKKAWCAIVHGIAELDMT